MTDVCLTVCLVFVCLILVLIGGKRAKDILLIFIMAIVLMLVGDPRKKIKFINR